MPIAQTCDRFRLEMELLQDLKMQGFDIEPGQLGEDVLREACVYDELGAGSIARLARAPS